MSIAVIAAVAVAAVDVRDGREHFLSIFGSGLGLFGEMMAGCLIGAFVTMILPRELVVRWVAYESGFTGWVVGLRLDAVRLHPRGGVGTAVLRTALRHLVWEVSQMPPRVVWLRAAVSLPLPFIAAALAMLLAQP